MDVVLAFFKRLFQLVFEQLEKKFKKLKNFVENQLFL